MYRFFLNLSRGFACLGGTVLAALAVLTCASVLGRWGNGLLQNAASNGPFSGVAQAFLDTGLGAIKGDYELIEAGIAFSIFAFLPLCQITGGHASVDIFTARLSSRSDRILRAVTEAAFAAVLVLIAVQLGAGMLSKLRTGQTSFLLQFPLWWAYALSLSGAIAAAMVAIYVAVARVIEAWTGRAQLPLSEGEE